MRLTDWRRPDTWGLAAMKKKEQSSNFRSNTLAWNRVESNRVRSSSSWLEFQLHSASDRVSDQKQLEPHNGTLRGERREPLQKSTSSKQPQSLGADRPEELSGLRASDNSQVAPKTFRLQVDCQTFVPGKPGPPERTGNRAILNSRRSAEVNEGRNGRTAGSGGEGATIRELRFGPDWAASRRVAGRDTKRVWRLSGDRRGKTRRRRE